MRKAFQGVEVMLLTAMTTPAREATRKVVSCILTVFFETIKL